MYVPTRGTIPNRVILFLVTFVFAITNNISTNFDNEISPSRDCKIDNSYRIPTRILFDTQVDTCTYSSEHDNISISTTNSKPGTSRLGINAELKFLSPFYCDWNHVYSRFSSSRYSDEKLLAPLITTSKCLLVYRIQTQLLLGKHKYLVCLAPPWWGFPNIYRAMSLHTNVKTLCEILACAKMPHREQ